MSIDKSIERAVEIGERNKRTVELISNWCAHVSIKKSGGTGIVEQQTGLPIGHRYLECQHAPASGMAGSDLALIALDFHDRNCVDCKFRESVGLPNLTTLLSQRDAHRAQQRQAQQRAEQLVAERLAAGESARQQIRPYLDTMAATTLDQISELDRTRSDDSANRLVQTAELAPETFPRQIVEHLFCLIDSGEYWLIEPSLATLARLPVDHRRLCNTALHVLRSFGARDAVVAIIEAHLADADQGPICDAVAELISLANPAPPRFGFPEHRSPLPGPLTRAYTLHTLAMRAALKALLEETDAYSVRMVARGLVVLAEQDSSLLTLLMPVLGSKLARAKWLVTGPEEYVEDAIHDVRSAMTLAFMAMPHECDAAIRSYLNGATPEGAVELHRVYQEVLDNVRRRNGIGELTEAHRLAFRRSVAAATQTDNEEVAKSAQEVFRGNPGELTPLAAEEIDLLLGSAAVVDTKLKEFGESKKVGNDFLANLEWNNRYSALCSLEKSFVNWACTAAGRFGRPSVQKVLSVLEGLPEDSDNLKAAIVRRFDSMMNTTEMLALCLPHYYSALVGPSQLVRASAARALGEMGRQVLENLPALVFGHSRHCSMIVIRLSIGPPSRRLNTLMLHLISMRQPGMLLRCGFCPMPKTATKTPVMRNS